MFLLPLFVNIRIKTRPVNEFGRGVSRSGFRERDGGIPGRDDLPIPRHRSREFCRETGLAIYLYIPKICT